MFVWLKVPKDIHSSDDGYGSHGSQEGRDRGSSGEEEKNNEKEELLPNADPGPEDQAHNAEPHPELLNEQVSDVPNDASPV